MAAAAMSFFHCCDSTIGINHHPTLSTTSVNANSNVICPAPTHFPDKALQSSSPPRLRRIILVRHGESEGNIDESVYTRVPDPRIGLTAKGWDQALATGRHIHEIASAGNVNDWKVYFYVSPYWRPIETLRGIGRAFDRSNIAGLREEPRLREQDFGQGEDACGESGSTMLWPFFLPFLMESRWLMYMIALQALGRHLRLILTSDVSSHLVNRVQT